MTRRVTDVVVLQGIVVAPLGDEPDGYVAVDTSTGYTFSTTLTSPVGQALLKFKGQHVQVIVRKAARE